MDIVYLLWTISLFLKILLPETIDFYLYVIKLQPIEVGIQ